MTAATRACLIFLLSLLLSVCTNAASTRRQSTIGTSNGYPLRWTINGYRLKYGSAAADWITGYQLSTTSTMTQALADQCTAYCTANAKCVTAHVVQYSGNTQEGNVLCQLYSVLQKKSDATYSTGFKGASGKVVASWAWRRDAVTTTTAAPTTTSIKQVTTSTAKTSTTTTVKASTTTTAKSSTTTTAKTSTTTSAKPTTTTAKTSSTTTAQATTTTAKPTTTTAQPTTTTAKPSTTTASPTTTTAKPTTTTTAKPTTTTAAPTSTTRTTTTTAGTTTSTVYPSSPSGATFYQYVPSNRCSGTTASVPLFANSLWSRLNTSTASSATRAYVVIHGAGRNFQDAYTQLGSNIDQSSSVLIAPNFYLPDDTPSIATTGTTVKSSNWYSPNTNLAWASYRDWVGGSDAVAPTSIRGTCSTFDVLDSIVTTLNDKSRYPSLTRIYLVGHSAGGSFMHHYAPLQNVAASSSTPITYVAFNTAAFLYFNTNRPSSIGSSCTTSYNDYIYGLGTSLPRYVSSRGGSDPTSAFKQWLTQDFRAGTGLEDTYAQYTFGDQTCPVQAQGGVNRRDRGFAMWVYKNILAGTGTDVSAYFGAKQFKAAGMKSVGNNGFNHKNCNVAGAGHVDSQMYSSACGQYYLGQSSTTPPNTQPVTTDSDETMAAFAVSSADDSTTSSASTTTTTARTSTATTSTASTSTSTARTSTTTARTSTTSASTSTATAK